jgi:hypothetical protein
LDNGREFVNTPFSKESLFVDAQYFDAVPMTPTTAMTPDQNIARKKQAVAAARSLLALDVGFVYGAGRVQAALRSIGNDERDLFPVFDNFLDAIPRVTPLGGLRLICEEGQLLSSDRDLAEVEHKFRNALLLECLAVVRAYGRGGNSV